MAEPLAPTRTLPHNLEAERSVLGAILIDNDAFNLAAAMHRRRATSSATRTAASSSRMVGADGAQPADRPRHAQGRARARAASSTRSAGPPTSPSLVDGVPRSTNVEYYARIVKEKSTLRSLIFSANKILGDAYEADQDADLILDEAESADLRHRRRPRASRASCRCATWCRTSFPTIEKLLRAQDARHRRAHRLRRPRRDDLGPAGRRPGHRRRAAVDGQDQPRAQHRASTSATHGRTSVGFFSLEMSKEQLFMRMLDLRGADRHAPPAERLPRRRRTTAGSRTRSRR